MYSKYKGNTMNKILLALVVMVGLTASTYANSPNDTRANIKPMSAKKIKKMDNRLTKHKAVRRNFKSQKEFSQRRQSRMNKQRRSTASRKSTASKHMRYDNNRYDSGYNYEAPETYREPYRPIRQRGYRYSKKGWILAYQYDRASFYDNEGYFYGYFNHYGYYFEDVFYRYDRYYSYRDRARGRGLFNQRYYMPTNASYYGFCAARYDDRDPMESYDR